jgi:signal transduction histidine kinase
VVLRVLRPFLDAGNESLLYLPVVIACALRYGFGSAVLAALVSFGCWDYFFDIPYFALTISSAHDCISLVIYLVVAVTTAHLAARAKVRTRESEARERETALLYRASSALSCEVDTDRSLLTLAEQIIYLCRASPCMIFVVNTQSTLETAVALSASLLTPENEAILRDTAQSALDNEGLLRIGPRASEAGDGESAFIDQPETGLYVSLAVQNTKVGVLHVGPSFDGQPLSSQDERMILTLANHASVVIARQLMAEEAKEQARQTAILDERNRLARDVHDTLSHAFTGIKFLLEAAKRIGSAEQTANCIDQARNLAIEGAQQARRSVLALRPMALEEAGNLVDALRKMAEAKSADGTTVIEVSATGEQRPISEMIEENLLRICQEALTNALKYAEASTVTVRALFDVLTLGVVIEDDGRGFDSTETQAGFGLTSMRERAELIHGNFEISSNAGTGTRITVQVPLIGEKGK